MWSPALKACASFNSTKTPAARRRRWWKRRKTWAASNHEFWGRASVCAPRTLDFCRGQGTLAGAKFSGNLAPALRALNVYYINVYDIFVLAGATFPREAGPSVGHPEHLIFWPLSGQNREYGRAPGLAGLSAQQVPRYALADVPQNRAPNAYALCVGFLKIEAHASP
jgi:hypothetical protein